MKNTLFEIQPPLLPNTTNEWYTPARYIEAARTVMGKIDLDPASCEQANYVVQASRYYSRQEDGLVQPWYGCVWLNPPYGTTGVNDHRGNTHTGHSNIKLFVQKLLHAYKDGHIEQAIVLCRADPSAYWFPPLWEYPICFVGGNFHFDSPRGKGTVTHRFGTCFVYLGPNVSTFVDVFRQFGRVAQAVDSPLLQTKMPVLWDTEARVS
jgi:hypothetical protein